MTQVLIEFELLRPLDDVLLKRIADAHGIYGMRRLTVAPTNDHLTVEYDASRLTPDQVAAALHRSGIPARHVTD